MQRLSFQPFDPQAPVDIYRRHLPHWRQRGATYLVTFRLADSIPRPIWESWQIERRQWLSAHGLSDELSAEEWRRRYRAISLGERKAFERGEARRLFVELDRCHGDCLLRQGKLARILIDALAFFDGERLQSGDAVVMPNHVHWLVMPLGDHELEDLLQSIKRYTSRRINQQVKRSGPLWQKENFDHLVRNADELARIRSYIANNPFQARLRPGQFAYYRAAWCDAP